MTPDLDLDLDLPEDTIPTTYIVSGHPRSGTSMMMKSLIAGGLAGSFKEHAPMTEQEYEYEANPGGFYEIGNAAKLPEFPKTYFGTVLKVIYRGLPSLFPGNYKVVYMLRNPDEVALSMSRFRDGKHPLRPRRHGWNRPADYFALMKHFLGLAMQRPDMEVLQVWYGDVLEDPLVVFERIRDFGIPIDPEAAAAIVTPDLYRNRVSPDES